jgi:hypothetical protein
MVDRCSRVYKATDQISREKLSAIDTCTRTECCTYCDIQTDTSVDFPHLDKPLDSPTHLIYLDSPRLWPPFFAKPSDSRPNSACNHNLHLPITYMQVLVIIVHIFRRVQVSERS